MSGWYLAAALILMFIVGLVVGHLIGTEQARNYTLRRFDEHR